MLFVIVFLNFIGLAWSFNSCGILRIKGSGTTDGYYVDTGATWNLRPVYADRFGAILYSTQYGGETYWQIGLEKVVDACNSNVEWRRKSAAMHPAELIGKPFAKECSQSENYFMEFSCVTQDPTLTCDPPSTAGCRDAHDFALVLDFSGSIDGIEMSEQWCLMRKLAVMLAPGVSNQRVSLVAFGNTAKVLVNLTSAGADVEQLVGGPFKISSPPTKPGTGLSRYKVGMWTGTGEGLWAAHASLQLGESTRTPSTKLGLILMTDGVLNAGREIAGAAAALKAMKVRSYEIAVVPPTWPQSTKNKLKNECVQLTESPTLCRAVPAFSDYVNDNVFTEIVSTSCALEASVCRDVVHECQTWGDPHYRNIFGDNYDFQGIGHYLLFDGNVYVNHEAHEGDDNYRLTVTTATRGVKRVDKSDVSINQYVSVQLGSLPKIEINAEQPDTVVMGGVPHDAAAHGEYLSDGRGRVRVASSQETVVAKRKNWTREVRTITFDGALSPALIVEVGVRKTWLRVSLSVRLRFSAVCSNITVGPGIAHSVAEWRKAFSNKTRGLCLERSGWNASSLKISNPSGINLAAYEPAVVTEPLFNCEDVRGDLSPFLQEACQQDVEALGILKDDGPDLPIPYAPGVGPLTDIACSAGCTDGKICNGGVCVASCSAHATEQTVNAACGSVQYISTSPPTSTSHFTVGLSLSSYWDEAGTPQCREAAVQGGNEFHATVAYRQVVLRAGECYFVFKNVAAGSVLKSGTCNSEEGYEITSLFACPCSSGDLCACQNSTEAGFWRGANCDHCALSPSAGKSLGYWGTHCQAACPACDSPPDMGAWNSLPSTHLYDGAVYTAAEKEFKESYDTMPYVSHTRPKRVKLSDGCSQSTNIDITFLARNSFARSVMGLYEWSAVKPNNLGVRIPSAQQLKPLFWDTHETGPCLKRRQSRISVDLEVGKEYAFFGVTHGWCAARIGSKSVEETAAAPLKFTPRSVPQPHDPPYTSEPDANLDGLQHFAFLDGDVIRGANPSNQTIVGTLIVGYEEYYGLGEADYNDFVFVLDGPSAGLPADAACGLVFLDGDSGPVRPPSVLRGVQVPNPPEKCRPDTKISVVDNRAQWLAFSPGTTGWWSGLSTLLTTTVTCPFSSTRKRDAQLLSVASPAKGIQEIKSIDVIENEKDIIWIIGFYSKACAGAEVVFSALESLKHAELFNTGMFKLGLAEESTGAAVFSNYNVQALPSLRMIVNGKAISFPAGLSVSEASATAWLREGLARRKNTHANKVFIQDV